MFDKAFRQDRRPTWLLAALPPLLFGVALSLLLLSLVSLPRVVWGGSTPLKALSRQVTIAPLVLCVILGLTLAIGAVVGALQRLPWWSHTWTTSTVVAVSFGLMILGDDRPYLIAPAVDMAIALALLLLLVGLALVAARRSPSEAALVGMGFVAAFALAVLFTAMAAPMLRLDIALWTLPAGLAFAALMAGFLRGGRAVRWAAMALAAALAAALIWQYKLTVSAALGAPYDVRFFRTLAGIAMIGLTAPLIVSNLLSLRPVRQ